MAVIDRVEVVRKLKAPEWTVIALCTDFFVTVASRTFQHKVNHLVTIWFFDSIKHFSVSKEKRKEYLNCFLQTQRCLCREKFSSTFMYADVYAGKNLVTLSCKRRCAETCIDSSLTKSKQQNVTIHIVYFKSISYYISYTFLSEKVRMEIQMLKTSHRQLCVEQTINVKLVLMFTLSMVDS
jgi:hypothetical protein